ncbi:MAG: transglutaminase domain-containing protein, partial [candidate division KSB1 bacterium]|nr:transglutaminase domain-containing protein [candidate division KSB1 bacterium]
AAQQLMRLELANNLNLGPLQRLAIAFEIERLDRIRKDFTKTHKEVILEIQRYVPNVKESDLLRWEQERSLEFRIIDGNKRYFNNAVPNLFRIDKNLKEIKRKQDGTPAPRRYNRLEDVRNIIQTSLRTGKKYVNPVRARVTYTLTLNKNAVPEGKVVRCWLPFPREIPGRQTDVKLISCFPEQNIVAPNDGYLQRTIYLEQPSAGANETKFQVVFEFTNYAVYQPIDPKQVRQAPLTPELAPYLSERPPHIVFSEDLKQLSRQIVGNETNPYFIARRIFKYIHDNIPWASAREYSTLENISEYVYQNRHCDCGMHQIFFMTLCRMNGIPTRWQSGWTTDLDYHGMHDWGEIYFEPYGWLPVDSDVGLLDSSNESERWFYLGGMDAYRLIINDDYAQHLYPAKIHFRSETLDFQRGEVEWEGGNLYFDQWDWDYEVELLQ